MSKKEKELSDDELRLIGRKLDASGKIRLARRVR